MQLKDFTPRLYQETILNTCVNKNTLVVLPTGMGKTAIALMLASYKLSQFPDSKILILSPTRPLIAQHLKTFQKHMDFPLEKLTLFTGKVPSEKRKELWQNSQIIFSTPQCIENDIEENRINLNNVSLVVFDESHRAVKEYSYVKVAQKYLEQSSTPKILALTASPGSTKEKIDEICKTLSIDAVEIRTEQDPDVLPYVQEKNISWINVELPEEFKKIHSLIKSFYLEKLKSLKKLGFSKPIKFVTKKDLLGIQADLRRRIFAKDKSAFHFISLVAQLIKIEYLLELIETQTIPSIKKYIEKLKIDTSKAAKQIILNKEIIEATNLINNLNEKNINHPKIDRIKEIISEEIKNNPIARIIIFANYRDVVDEILNLLKQIPNAKPTKLVGQKLGLTQKEQIKTIRLFEEGLYNILICTSIGEEGIDIKGGAELAIFFDSTASEIRRIQRGGRIARLKSGKIIFLITKGTRDEAFYWASLNREKKMKSVLYKMQEKQAKL